MPVPNKSFEGYHRLPDMVLSNPTMFSMVDSDWYRRYLQTYAKEVFDTDNIKLVITKTSEHRIIDVFVDHYYHMRYHIFIDGLNDDDYRDDDQLKVYKYLCQDITYFRRLKIEKMLEDFT